MSSHRRLIARAEPPCACALAVRGRTDRFDRGCLADQYPIDIFTAVGVARGKYSMGWVRDVAPPLPLMGFVAAPARRHVEGPWGGDGACRRPNVRTP